MDDDVVVQSISFFDMPHEMRMLVINKADPKTRCALAQCSKICKEEVEMSDTYIDSIEVVNLRFQGGLVMFVGHREDRQDYALSFERVAEDTIDIVRTCISDGQIFLRSPVVTSQSIHDFSLNFFKSYMISFRRCVRKLVIRGEHLDWNWEELRWFRRLEELEARDHATTILLLPKTGATLIRLATAREEVEGYSDQLAHTPQVYNVTNKIYLPRTLLDDDQLSRIRAKTIVLPTGYITADGLIRFINQWRNGERNGHISLKLIWWSLNRLDAEAVLNAFVEHFIAGERPPFRFRQLQPNQSVGDLRINREEGSVDFTFSVV